MRDRRGRSPSPRLIGQVVGRIREEITPPGGLAAVQAAWAEAVGESVAAVSRPVAEREGVVTVECDGAVWAEELGLMEARIRARLEQTMGDTAPERIKFRST